MDLTPEANQPSSPELSSQPEPTEQLTPPPEPIEPPPVPPTQPIQPAHHSLPWTFIWIILFFIGLMLGMVGKNYYLAQTIVVPTLTPSLNPSSTPTPSDSTADWKTYTNSKHSFSLKYPNSWYVNDIFNPNVKQPPIVELHTTDRDYTYGQAGDLNLSSQLDPISSTRLREIGIVNSGTKQSFGNISGTLYETDGIGEGSAGYRIDFIFNDNSRVYWIYLSTDLKNKIKFKEAFDQILSTFKFVDSTSGAVATTSYKKALVYSLPAGWKTVQDKTGTIEVGYDPSANHPATDQVSGLFVVIMPNDGGSYRYIVGLKPYNGGSRHKFIWSSDQPDYKYPNYQEKEYTYNSWSCLVLYGAIISQGPDTNGMCAVSSKQAFYIGYKGIDTSAVEKVVQTIKLLK